ncbi:TetR/AcrR family transcriptional regulator [Algiphilus aromaticivorans]|jgi:AcrR family transcriptional regulator|uniref:TetR/AcrR family transcriptional regulator n=1 Tax=Algiphilus aromaticivorans TaxID=382454 RepID=UPI0005C1AA7E|nr:TetR/AcrR family transcriptional regulator [Algiphilus aromaticivorans]
MAYRRSARMQARLDDNRRRIREAARRIIARGGFRQAQMAAIAEAAELSTGSLYRYFPSKAELFIDVLGAAAEREIQLLDAIAAGSGTPAERLEAAVKSYVGRALEGPHLAHAFMVEPVEPELDSARQQHRKRVAAAFARVLETGIAEGDFPEQDAGLSASCLVGAMTEALSGPTAEAPETPVERAALLERISTFCLRAVAENRDPTRIAD